MFKYILFTTLLVLLAFCAGVWVDFIYAPLAPYLRVSNNKIGVLSGPLSSEIRTVNGKVSSVSGKSMTVEANGQNVTVIMGNEVSIVSPSATPSASIAPTPSSTPGAVPSQEKDKYPDFNRVKVGSEVSVVMELQPDGRFLAKSVFLAQSP